MRKFLIVPSFLMIASLLLTACGAPAATPAPATAAPATAAPATVAPAAAAVATVAPTQAAVDNPYLGSGKLDGNGAPPDFFSDVHIRRAFAYAFDWDTYARDMYNTEAVQSLELPLLGMPGYDPNAPHFTFDLAKSEAEFKLADLDHDGIAAGDETDNTDVWKIGFRIQMLYNQGNTVRQTVAEIMQATLSQVNPLFIVETLGLPWPAYLAAQRAGQIPIMTYGWQEDIHDPHNWYQPYTTGSGGSRQHLPAELIAQLKSMMDQGVAKTDPAERSKVYYQLNQTYYDNAVGFPLVTATQHVFEQSWVQGRIMNPIYPGINFATISKAAGAPNPTTFTRASIADIIDLDPALAYDTSSGEVLQNVYETLVTYDGAATDKFVPLLADSYEVSPDGLVYTFHIRPNVKFQSGNVLTASDVAYTFQRGLLQGGYVSPQLMFAEPFFGVGKSDISLVVDESGALADDQASMIAAAPAKLKAACELVKSEIVADDAASTVTMTLKQAWGPFLATLSQTWGVVLEKKWVVENAGWDGSCDTWQKFYASTTETDSINRITNGTGPFKVGHWTPTEEIVLVRNPDYWGKAPAMERVVRLVISEFGTRFAMLQAGDLDQMDVQPDQRPQVDPFVGVMRIFDLATNQYGPDQEVCSVNQAALGQAKFIPCGAGKTGTNKLRLYIGRPGINQDVVTFNFDIR
jgi:ABC-type transport system substrate-binding protein